MILRFIVFLLSKWPNLIRLSLAELRGLPRRVQKGCAFLPILLIPPETGPQEECVKKTETAGRRGRFIRLRDNAGWPATYTAGINATITIARPPNLKISFFIFRPFSVLTDYVFLVVKEEFSPHLYTQEFD